MRRTYESVCEREENRRRNGPQKNRQHEGSEKGCRQNAEGIFLIYTSAGGRVCPCMKSSVIYGLNVNFLDHGEAFRYSL